MTLQNRVAIALTKFSGSMGFVYLHLFWFGLWIVTNGLHHDPFPYGLLTMIVSLEAIILSTFVMISQNLEAQIADQRAEKDFEVNLRAEREVSEIKAILSEIKEKL